MKKLIFMLCLFVAVSMQSCVAYVHPMGDGRGRGGEHHDEGHHDNGHHEGNEHHDDHH